MKTRSERIRALQSEIMSREASIVAQVAKLTAWRNIPK